MPNSIRHLLSSQLQVVQLAILAFVLSLGWFFYDGDVRVNLADEGYLWYGSTALRAGQVPIRDFYAYDPGRYLWTAVWSFVLGEGVVSLRQACVFFQCFGVLAGLLAARRLSRNWIFLGFVAVFLCAWMHPRYKIFEQSISLMFIYAAVLLLERPSLRRHFWVGIFGGAMAFVGKNHGAYHVLAFGLIITIAAWGEGWRTWLQRTGTWVTALLLGYLPQWLMFLFVPGYFRSFVENTREIFEKGTNLAMAVRWPWSVPAEYTYWWRWSAICEGWFYLLFPIFLVVALVRAGRLGRSRLLAHPVFVASACVTLPYTHYVFSRPDVVHLSHGAPALVMGLVALAFTWPVRGTLAGLVLAPILAVASLLANMTQFGATVLLTARPGTLFPIEVAGETMLAPGLHAQVLSAAHKLATDLAEPDESIFFIPHTPGLYPFTGRFSPTRQTYFIVPAKPEEDRRVLAEIEKADVQWVLFHDYPLDGREDLRFRNTYPIVFEFLRTHFEVIPVSSLPNNMFILHRIQRP